MNDDYDSNETGFLDVAANTLAVILIVSVFAIQKIQQQTSFRIDPYAKEVPSLNFPLTAPRIFPPYSKYYLVFYGGIVAWDQEKAVQKLDNETFQGTVHADGIVIFTPTPFQKRDIDSYRVTWKPDFEQLQKRLQPIDDETVGILVTQFSNMYDNDNVSPTFLVFSSGMSAFTKLYPYLVDPKQGLNWRWYNWEKGRPIVISRSYRNFATLGNTW